MACIEIGRLDGQLNEMFTNSPPAARSSREARGSDFEFFESWSEQLTLTHYLMNAKFLPLDNSNIPELPMEHHVMNRLITEFVSIASHPVFSEMLAKGPTWLEELYNAHKEGPGVLHLRLHKKKRVHQRIWQICFATVLDADGPLRAELQKDEKIKAQLDLADRISTEEIVRHNYSFPKFGLLMKAWRLPANEKSSLCAELLGMPGIDPSAFPDGIPMFPPNSLATSGLAQTHNMGCEGPDGPLFKDSNLALEGKFAHPSASQVTEGLMLLDKDPSTGLYMHVCCACGGKKAVKKCSRCQVAYYCNRECQVADWKRHKGLGCRARTKSATE